MPVKDVVRWPTENQSQILLGGYDIEHLSERYLHFFPLVFSIEHDRLYNTYKFRVASYQRRFSVKVVLNVRG